MLKLKNTVVTLLLLSMTIAAAAQDSLHLSLKEAVQTGVDSSKKLMLAEAKVQEAINQLAQAKDRQLPTAKASLTGSEAVILTRTLQIEDLMKKPLHLPATSTMYIGTLSVNEAIFAGNKMRYAKTSARLLQKVAELEKAHDKEGVILSIIHAYVNLYEIDQNVKIIRKNIADVQGRLEETIQFKEQGLATLNDVLRFRLEKSRARLTLIDLQNNRTVANYALTTLLGLPEGTVLRVDSVGQQRAGVRDLDYFISEALQKRKDMKVFAVQGQLNETHIKSLKADKLPVLGAGINTYYVNPSGSFFPPKHNYLVPVTIGLNLSWDISSLYTTKNKVSAARIQQYKIDVSRAATADNIRIAVNKDYHAYLQSLQHINVLQTAVEQARENDRIMELKYQNQLATTTDRIDAQTMLYKSMVDLAVARADAAMSWYQLLRSTGKLNTIF